MGRLRSKCQVQLCYTPLYTLRTDFFVICFNNAQSVKLHLEDIISERNFSRTDIIIFSESKLCRQDNMHISVRTLHKNDFAVQRTLYGSAVVTKPDHKILVEWVNATVLEMTLISDFATSTNKHLRTLSTT